jgi:ankyrin repeat protein
MLIKTPQKFRCPLTGKLMKNPVIYQGIICEKAAAIAIFSPFYQPATYQPATELQNEILHNIQFNNICTEEEFIAAIENNNLAFIATHNFFDVYLDVYLPFFSEQPIAFNEYCTVIKPTLLLKMIADGQEEMLLLFLKQGVNFNQIIEVKFSFNDKPERQAQGKYSLLSFIIEKKLNRLAIELILLGIALQYPECTASPLHTAAFTNNDNVLNVLLLKTIDVDEKAPDGNTALHMAVSKGCLQATELLISYGADLNSLNKQGDTPINYAILNEQSKVVMLLLEKGANLNLPNRYGTTPAMRAEKRGCHKIITILELYSDEIDSDVSLAELNDLFRELNPLIAPASAPNPIETEEKLRQLAKNKIFQSLDLNYLFFKRNDVLAETNAKEEESKNNEKELRQLFQRLYDNSASHEIQSDYSAAVTLASTLTPSGELDNARVEVFDEQSLGNNNKDENGDNSSAVGVVTSFQPSRVSPFLLSNTTTLTSTASTAQGAYLNSTRLASNTLRLAERNDESSNIFNFNSLFFAATLNDADSLKKIIKEVDINTRDEQGRSNVFLAVKFGYLIAIKLLSEHGADVNLPDNNGCTPLYVAAELGYADVVELLLGLGANPEIFSINGKKPIDVAKESCKHLFPKPFVQQVERTVCGRNSSTTSIYPSPSYPNRHFTWKQYVPPASQYNFALNQSANSGANKENEHIESSSPNFLGQN